MPRDNGRRPTRHWTFAQEHRTRFEDILPANVCEAAMATCRFEIQGVNANGNEWGIGFRTMLQTFGNAPLGTGLPGQPFAQITGNFCGLDSHEAASIVLDCFGLTARQVLDYYGEPAFGDRLKLDLFEVVADLRPEFGLRPQENVQAVA